MCFSLKFLDWNDLKANQLPSQASAPEMMKTRRNGGVATAKVATTDEAEEEIKSTLLQIFCEVTKADFCMVNPFYQLKLRTGSRRPVGGYPHYFLMNRM